jgi:hypothetical protein
MKGSFKVLIGGLMFLLSGISASAQSNSLQNSVKGFFKKMDSVVMKVTKKGAPSKKDTSTLDKKPLIQNPFKKSKKDTSTLEKKPLFQNPFKKSKQDTTISDKKPLIQNPFKKSKQDTMTLDKKPLIQNPVKKQKQETEKKPKLVVEAKVKDTSTKSFKEQWSNLTSGISKSLSKGFSDFSDNHVNLLAGINFSKQTIDAGGYTSPFNYNESQIGNNNFKPGFTLGYIVDGVYKKKHEYSLAVNINKYTAGANYQSNTTLAPFIGSFSHFKADDQFATLGIAAHYKKRLPVLDPNKYKLYVVAGPNLETRLSNQSLDNQVASAYHKMLLRADLGVEFDNNGYYTIYLHYHQPITSFTSDPIKTKFTTLELGMMLRASDIF